MTNKITGGLYYVSETIQLTLIKSLMYAWATRTRTYIYIYVCMNNIHIYVCSVHTAYSWRENFLQEGHTQEFKW